MRVSFRKKSIKVSWTKFGPFRTKGLRLNNFSHFSSIKPIIIPQERISLISERYLATLMILASYLQSRVKKIPSNRRKSQPWRPFRSKKSKSLIDLTKKRKTSKKL